MEGKHSDSSKKRKPRGASGAPAEKRKRPENRETPSPNASQTTKDSNSDSSQNSIPAGNPGNSNAEKNREVNNNRKEVGNSQQSDNSLNDPPSQDTSTKATKDENSQRTLSDVEPAMPSGTQSTEPSATATQSVEEILPVQIPAPEKSPDIQPKEDTNKRIKFIDQTPKKGTSKPSTHQDDPQTSTGDNSMSNRRRRCIYGAKCYRRSSDHLDEFSHPGDDDYEIKDQRPVCKYGSKCYRTGAKHLKEFQHTKAQRKRTSTPVRSRGSDDESDVSSDEESVDESEYDPSGIDDSSDDGEEYESDV